MPDWGGIGGYSIKGVTTSAAKSAHFREGGPMTSETAQTQVFSITINWSPESGARLTEGDMREAIEQMALEIDEEAVVDVAEVMDHGF